VLDNELASSLRAVPSIQELRLDGLRDARFDRLLSARVISILLPAANGPIGSIRSMSPLHSGQAATSDHNRQICSGATVVSTVVSTLCSFAHIVSS
jgi:hypothetical protein